MTASLPPLPRAVYDAAIVDLDGTMIDTVGDFDVALARTADDLGLPRVDRDFIARTVGRGSEHLLRRMLEHVGAPASRYERAWSLYQHHYLAINGRHADVFPGVVDGLAALRAAGLKLACLTNKPTSFMRPLLAAKGLDRWFDIAFGGDAFARQKPDPLPMVETCRALGADPARTLVIGDSRNDAEAARGAGCPVVLMRYGYNHGEPAEAAGPDAVADRIDEIAGWIAPVDGRVAAARGADC